MKKLSIFFALFSLFTSTYFIACNSQAGDMISEPAPAVQTSDLSKPIIIYSNIEDCSVRILERYVFERYEPMPGKTFGIYVQNGKWGTDKIAEARTKWGFNYILATPDVYSYAINSGFDQFHIMMPVEQNTFSERMNSYGTKVWAYYIPEPKDAGNDWDVNSFCSQRNFSAPGIPLIMDGYKRTKSFSQAVSYCDVVMFSSYVHWTNYGLFWSDRPAKGDQRDDWTDMRSRYGNKFSMTWISLLKDNGTYGDLLGHAANLGLTGVWLFANDCINDLQTNESALAAFCEEAWRHGWLRKIEALHMYHYKCTLPDPCSNCNDSDPAAWILVGDIKIEQFREVYP